MQTEPQLDSEDAPNQTLRSAIPQNNSAAMHTPSNVTVFATPQPTSATKPSELMNLFFSFRIQIL